MNYLSNNHAKSLLNYSLRNGPRYIGLFLSTPGPDNTGVEVVGGSYARKQISFSEPQLVVGKYQVSNSNEIDFGQMTADIGAVAFWGIFDSVSDGNLLWFGPFSRARNILSGDAILIKTDAIICTLE